MAHLFSDFGLADPDDIGQTEYRVMYELLEQTVGDDTDEDEPWGLAIAILMEFEHHARDMADLISFRSRGRR